MAEKSLKERAECGEALRVPIESRTRVCLLGLSGWPVKLREGGGALHSSGGVGRCSRP